MPANATSRTAREPRQGEQQIATFYVGNLLMGVDIRQIQEINRHLDITRVPLAPSFVEGVANLRGEVVTIINLRSVLGLTPAPDVEHRYVVLQSPTEAIGLTVDRIADVLSIPAEDFVAPPASVEGVEGRFFEAVCALQQELLVLLNVDEIIDI